MMRFVASAAIVGIAVMLGIMALFSFEQANDDESIKANVRKFGLAEDEREMRMTQIM